MSKIKPEPVSCCKKECSICLKRISKVAKKSNDELHTTDCGHCFHEGCIQRWYETSPSCPMCRSKSRKIHGFSQIMDIYHSHRQPTQLEQFLALRLWEVGELDYWIMRAIAG